MKILKKEIYLKKAGTLKNFISENEKMSLTHLKLSGYLNSNDFDELADMCTSSGEFDDDDNHTIHMSDPPFLTVLDLGDSQLIDKPSLGEFTYYSKLEEFVCPKNLESTSDMSVFDNSLFLKTFVIPETFKEFGFGSFMHCEKLENINFPESIERIGGLSFSGCRALKNIKIPANVSIIESAAFGGCYKLRKFEIDKRNTHFSVVDGVLYNHDKTKLVAFPCGYKSKHYSVPEGVKIIGDGSFLNSLIESIDFPSSLEIIEGWAFRFCRNLKSIHIPDSVTEIGGLAFEFCYSLDKVKLPNNLSILKSQSFSGCHSLKEIDIPASVKIIESSSLGCSDGLESILLHDGLEVLNDFPQCKQLKNIVIPKTVKIIASGIFRECTSMNQIQIDNNNPYFCTIDGSLYSKDKTILIAVPYNEHKTFDFPHGIQIIEDYVFEGFDKIEQLVFPDTLQVIKHRAFDGCLSLKAIHFPKFLTSIDFRAFDDCENLKTIEIEAETPPIITNPLASCWQFFGDAKHLTLYVPKESLKEYKKAFGWKAIKNIKTLT